jgi:hypothetical protein
VPLVGLEEAALRGGFLLSTVHSEYVAGAVPQRYRLGIISAPLHEALSISIACGDLLYRVLYAQTKRRVPRQRRSQRRGPIRCYLHRDAESPYIALAFAGLVSRLRMFLKSV